MSIAITRMEARLAATAADVTVTLLEPAARSRVTIAATC